MDIELVTNPLLKVWHTQTGYPAEKSVNDFISFVMLNIMGQDCKDEELSTMPHEG